MSPRRLGLAVAALMTVLWAVGALVPPPRLHGTALDLRWYFFPLYEAFYGALRAGAPMLWNPYQACGMPVVGTLQGGFFYPPHVLYLVLPIPAAFLIEDDLLGNSLAEWAESLFKAYLPYLGFGGAFWLNILLTLLGYIPGIVHAVYIIAKR